MPPLFTVQLFRVISAPVTIPEISFALAAASAGETFGALPFVEAFEAEWPGVGFVVVDDDVAPVAAPCAPVLVAEDAVSPVAIFGSTFNGGRFGSSWPEPGRDDCTEIGISLPTSEIVEIGVSIAIDDAVGGWTVYFGGRPRRFWLSHWRNSSCSAALAEPRLTLLRSDLIRFFCSLSI